MINPLHIFFPFRTIVSDFGPTYTDDGFQKHLNLCCLHELQSPDGSEKMLLRLVASHILLKSLRALGELKHSRVDLLILAVKDVLDELHVICPHSHLEEVLSCCIKSQVVLPLAFCARIPC